MPQFQVVSGVLDHFGSTSVGTTPVKIVLGANVKQKIKLHNSGTSGDVLYVTAVVAGASAPGNITPGTNLMDEVPVGSSIVLDEHFCRGVDVYIAAKSGTDIVDAWSIA